MRRPTAQDERVAIRCGAGDPADADVARSASNVFNDDRLTKRPSHPVGHDAADRVGRPARGKRHHHRDGACGVDLGGRAAGRRTGNECDGNQRLPHGWHPHDRDGDEVCPAISYLTPGSRSGAPFTRAADNPRRSKSIAPRALCPVRVARPSALHAEKCMYHSKRYGRRERLRRAAIRHSAESIECRTADTGPR